MVKKINKQLLDELEDAALVYVKLFKSTGLTAHKGVYDDKGMRYIISCKKG